MVKSWVGVIVNGDFSYSAEFNLLNSLFLYDKFVSQAMVKKKLIREIYNTYLSRIKISLYQLFFKLVSSRLTYTCLKGTILLSFRKKLIHLVRYKQSICNAGIIRKGNEYICSVKNQTFSLSEYS